MPLRTSTYNLNLNFSLNSNAFITYIISDTFVSFLIYLMTLDLY